MVKQSTDANYHVRAVSRALAILGAFCDGQADFTLDELSKRLDLNKSTLIRLLAVLQEEQFVEQDVETERYHLGLKAFEVGSAYYIHQLRVDQIARPYMTVLTNRWRCSANLAILDKAQIVYIGLVEPRGLLRVRSSLGARLDVHYTALGKVLVSELPARDLAALLEQQGMEAMTPHTITTVPEFIEHVRDVRERGYAFDDEEVLPGVRCVAAPIRDHSGHIVAALSVSGSSLQITPAAMDLVAADVMQATAEISRRMGYRFAANGEGLVIATTG